MAELEALKKDKGETEEARKRAEEQIEAMRKEHEEKVISISSFSLLRNFAFFAEGNKQLLKNISTNVYSKLNYNRVVIACLLIN